ALMAVSLLGAVYSINRAPFWYVSLFRWWRPEGIVGLVTMNTTAVFSILLLPVLFAGTILPLVIVGAVPPDAERTGGVVGRVYAVNTVGAILGAMLGDMPSQVMLAEIPLLLAEHADDVLVVGWGSGVTVGSVLRGGAKRVTAFEIEPAVLEASHFFDRVNHQPLRDPRLTVYLG